MQGEYLIWMPQPRGKLFARRPDFIIPNLIPDGGKDEFYKMLLQNVTAVAGGANFFVGMCDQTPLAADLIASITTEPTAAGGYARQPIVRSAVGWPTLSTVNGRRAITSLTITFTAAGADFSRTYSRLFLTDAVGGGATKLYSVSGALTVPIVVPNGQSVQAQYRLYM